MASLIPEEEGLYENDSPSSPAVVTINRKDINESEDGGFDSEKENQIIENNRRLLLDENSNIPKTTQAATASYENDPIDQEALIETVRKFPILWMTSLKF